jgi:hypothetical protein
MATFQDVIDDVRVVLQDADGTRYTSPQLMSYANDGVQEGFRLRPDFLLGQYTAAATVYTAVDNVPFRLATRCCSSTTYATAQNFVTMSTR